MGDSTSSNSVLLFGDAHFNPFADPTLVKALAASDVSAWKSILSSSSQSAYAPYGSDTNYALLESALDDMAARAKNVQTILYPGDILGHNFNQLYASLTGDQSQAGVESFIAKTVTFFVQELDRRFPNATVIVADGNSDNSVGGFGARPGDPYLAITAPILAQAFFNTEEERAAFTSSYTQAGYYAVEPDGQDGVKYIALNDTLWATAPYGDPVAGQTELTWFSAELAESAAIGQKVWVVGHIPVGDYTQVSAQSVLQTGTLAYSPILDESFDNAFVALETTYAQTIAANFAGHTHNDDFRIISNGDAAWSTLQRITPSISPVFANNPGYQIYTVDPVSFALLDETTYTLDLQAQAPTWSKEYDYAQTYGVGLGTQQDWQTAYAGILTNPCLATTYVNNLVQGAVAQSPVTTANAAAYLLTPGFVTSTSYNEAAALLRTGLAAV